MLMAITTQHAHELVLGDEVMRWRMWPLASVGKQEAVSQPMLTCVIWTSTNRMAEDGVPLFGGAQLAVDTTLVSTLQGDGSARRRAAAEDGSLLLLACPESERDPLPRVGGPPCQSAAYRPGGRSRWALV